MSRNFLGSYAAGCPNRGEPIRELEGPRKTALDEPPAVGPSDPILGRQYRCRHLEDSDVDLADCHAYGDSLADLPMLELVGHPHPINPDFRLSREARRRRWPVETWTTE